MFVGSRCDDGSRDDSGGFGTGSSRVVVGRAGMVDVEEDSRGRLVRFRLRETGTGSASVFSTRAAVVTTVATAMEGLSGDRGSSGNNGVEGGGVGGGKGDGKASIGGVETRASTTE